MRYLSAPKKTFNELLAFKLKDRNSFISLVLYVSLFLTILYPFFYPSKAHATVTESFVRFDRLATGAAVSGTACLKTSTAGTETGVIIDFPLNWTISGTAGNWTTTTTNLPVDPADNSTTATAWPGIGTATAVTGISVRFPSTDLTTTVFYCFNFAGASSTLGAAGNDKVGALKTQGGSPFVDNSSWATSVVAASADQITVSASVSATLTFSLSANTAALSTLVTSGSPTSATAINQSVITNAQKGWASWVKSANAALNSAATGGSIASNSPFNGTPKDLSALSSGYVLDVNLNSGTATVNAEYNGTGNVNNGGFLDTQFHQTAQHTATPTVTDVVDLVVRAKAASTTPAASDYADTLTVVVAGNF